MLSKLSALLAILAIQSILAKQDTPQPEVSKARYESKLESYNDLIPKRPDTSKYFRVIALDGRGGAGLSEGNFWKLISDLTPTVGMFIGFPQNIPESVGSIQKALKHLGYYSELVYNDKQSTDAMLAISKFPFSSSHGIPTGSGGREYFADWAMKISPPKTEPVEFHLLCINLAPDYAHERDAQASAVVRRMETLIASKQPFLVAGGVGNSGDAMDVGLMRIKASGFCEDVFSTLNWPKPKFTDSHSLHRVDYIFVGSNIKSALNGAYVYFWDKTRHLPLVADLSLKGLMMMQKSHHAKGLVLDNYQFKMMLYWAAFVGFGLMLVILLSYLVHRHKKSNSKDGEWTREPSKDTLATFETADNGERPEPRIIRIQTPPCYPPPPPYSPTTATSPEKS